MALRLAQQRAARTTEPAAEPADGVTGLATVRALFGDDQPPIPEPPAGGDDDDPDELDAGPAEDLDRFYDDAFGSAQ
jgi:hypothetical protein